MQRSLTMTRRPKSCQKYKNTTASQSKTFTQKGSAKKCQEEETAAREVFNITELCEQILEYLSLENLYYAQNICRSTRVVVKGSLKLQIKLFKKPAKALTWEFKPKCGASPLSHVPRYGRHFVNEQTSALTVRPLVINTLLVELVHLRYGTSQNWSGFKWNQGKIVAVNLPLDKHETWPNACDSISLMSDAIRCSSRYASCRHMYLTQPPVLNAQVYIQPHNASEFEPKIVEVSNPNGVRLNHILKAVNDHNNHERSIGVKKGRLLCIKLPDEVLITPETKAAVEKLLEDRQGLNKVS